VPAAVPGIVFLSGGQSDLQATAHLNAMNSQYEGLPWELSFSYARALQGQPMEIWGGEVDKVQAAQKAFYHRAKMNSAARSGDYSEEMEEQARRPARAALSNSAGCRAHRRFGSKFL
jgi:fructose-bisphosphate aldolase, class I